MIVCGLFEWKQVCAIFYCLFIYELELKIQLSEGGLDPIDWFNLTTFLCLSQASTRISNAIYVGMFFVFSGLW